MCHPGSVSCDFAYARTSPVRPLPLQPTGLLYQPTIKQYFSLSVPVLDGVCRDSEWDRIRDYIDNLDDILSLYSSRLDEQAPRVVYDPLEDFDRLRRARECISQLERVVESHPCSARTLRTIFRSRGALHEFMKMISDTVNVLQRMPNVAEGYIGHLVPFLHLAGELSYVFPMDQARIWPINIDLVLTLSQLDAGQPWRFGFYQAPDSHYVDWTGYTAERPWIPMGIARTPAQTTEMDWADRIDTMSEQISAIQELSYMDVDSTESIADFIHSALIACTEGSAAYIRGLMRTRICEVHPGIVGVMWDQDGFSSVHACGDSRMRTAIAYFCGASLEFQQRVTYALKFTPRRDHLNPGEEFSGSISADTLISQIGALSLLEFHHSYQDHFAHLRALIRYIKYEGIQTNNISLLRGTGRVLALALASGVLHELWRLTPNEWVDFVKNPRIRRGVYDWFHEGAFEGIFSPTEIIPFSQAVAARRDQSIVDM